MTIKPNHMTYEGLHTEKRRSQATIIRSDDGVICGAGYDIVWEAVHNNCRPKGPLTSVHTEITRPRPSPAAVRQVMFAASSMTAESDVTWQENCRGDVLGP